MEMVLIREKLWSIVCKRKPRPEDDDARILEWDEEAERATATIFLCLSEAAEKHVQDLRDPVKIWDKLKDVYEARGFSARFLLWRNLFNLKLEDSVENYIDELTSLRQQLKQADFEVPEEIIVSVLLNGLHNVPGWKGFVTATTQSLRNVQQADIKPDDLINQLLDESHRRKANAVAELDYNKALAAKTNPKKRLRKQCEHCLKSGHLEADCWIKYPSKRPHSEDTVNAKWTQAL